MPKTIVVSTIEKTVYSPKEVSKLLSVNIKTVYASLARGEIHGVRVGKNWLIPIKSFNEFLESKGGL